MTFAKVHLTRREEKTLVIRGDRGLEDLPLTIGPLRDLARRRDGIEMRETGLFGDEVGRRRVRQPSHSLNLGATDPRIVVQMVEYLCLGGCWIDQRQPAIFAVVRKNIRHHGLSVW